MQRKESFQELVARAEAGDPRARVQVESQLAHKLMLAVRKTLQTGREQSSLEHRIFTEARRLGFRGVTALINNQEEFFQKVARRVSHHLVANMPVRRSAGFMTADTVGNAVESELCA